MGFGGDADGVPIKVCFQVWLSSLNIPQGGSAGKPYTVKNSIQDEYSGTHIGPAKECKTPYL